MSGTLILSFLKEKLRSPIRLGLLFIYLFGVVSPTLVHGSGAQAPNGGNAFLYVVILGAGVIGLDVSSGVLQLLFARPVKRCEYVLSRWAALGGAAFLVHVALTLVVLAIIVLRGGTLRAGDLGGSLFTALFTSFGVAATVVFFSSLAPSIADIGLMFILFQTSLIGSFIARLNKLGWLEGAFDELQYCLVPVLQPSLVVDKGHVYFFPAVLWLFVVTFSLGLAIVMVNRKELSYAGR